ncbi:unnamed protein product [Linum trigynum]|uniref:Uncharacterized protein n=1 Tax=Linum trigynum TaxID=586398 RepID=A0AAV2G903_9ROSI
MLSTDLGGVSVPAPILLPSDRPPGLSSSPAIAEPNQLLFPVAAVTSSIDMAIDSSVLTVQERPVQLPVGGSQAG